MKTVAQFLVLLALVGGATHYTLLRANVDNRRTEPRYIKNKGDGAANALGGGDAIANTKTTLRVAKAVFVVRPRVYIYHPPTNAPITALPEPVPGCGLEPPR